MDKIIAKKLLQIKAIKLSPQNPFTWASGMKSPIYCDNRVTLSYPAVRQSIVDGFVQLAKQFEGVDHISGVATAGIAHGALLANALDLPFSYIRSKPKAHGRQNQIEGHIAPGSKILVVEDLISTGGSSIQAVDVLKENGFDVVGVVAIFNYGFQKAVDNFENAGCAFATISNYSVLLKEAIAENYITQEQAEILKSWNADPENWYSSNF